MSFSTRVRLIALIALFGVRTYTQGAVAPVNDLPNPYRLVDEWVKMPEGRQFGASASIQVDRDGESMTASL
jgi:hypothetical protein